MPHASRPSRVQAIVAIPIFLFLFSGLPAHSQGPKTVGVFESLNLASAHPYPPDDGAPSWQRTIRFPSATYVRLHVSSFELADGDWLEIAGPDGRESHAYAGRGPHGTGEFWAFAVPGEEALLTLHAPTGYGLGIEIDGAGRGTEPLFAPDSEPSPTGEICGAMDWRDAKCYESSRPTEYASSLATVLALKGCCRVCTAFKVSDGGQFMFSEMCMNDGNVRDVELRLENQATGCDSGVVASSGSVMGNSRIAGDHDLDFILVDTIGDSSAIPCLQLDRRMPDVGERIYIAHQPMGNGTKLSIESDQNDGGLCAVDVAPIYGNAVDTDIGYLCDTHNASLGAPILSGSTHRVVAIQHYGACPNQGTRADRIYERVAGVLGVCSNGTTCQPIKAGRCDCDGVCSRKESRYVERGGVCPDCEAPTNSRMRLGAAR